VKGSEKWWRGNMGEMETRKVVGEAGVEVLKVGAGVEVER